MVWHCRKSGQKHEAESYIHSQSKDRMNVHSCSDLASATLTLHRTQTQGMMPPTEGWASAYQLTSSSLSPPDLFPRHIPVLP